MNTEDPAAAFAASKSLHEACMTATIGHGLSEAYSGGDEFLRQCARVGTLFEKWASARVDFTQVSDVWPYLLEDKFGPVVLHFLTPLELASFNEASCGLVAAQLGLVLCAAPMTAAEFLAQFPESDSHDGDTLEDMACRKCGSRRSFFIGFNGTARVHSDGSDDVGDHEWDADSACRCAHCDAMGAVADFTIPGLDDLLAESGTAIID